MMSWFEALFCSFVIVCVLTIILMVVISIIFIVRRKKGKMGSFREQRKFDEYCSKIKEGTILCKTREYKNPFYEPNTDRIKIIERRGDWVKYAYETTPTVKKILKTDWTDYYISTYPIETIYRLGYKIEENY
jgi:hypothetical protein